MDKSWFLMKNENLSGKIFNNFLSRISMYKKDKSVERERRGGGGRKWELIEKSAKLTRFTEARGAVNG